MTDSQTLDRRASRLAGEPTPAELIHAQLEAAQRQLAAARESLIAARRRVVALEDVVTTWSQFSQLLANSR